MRAGVLTFYNDNEPYVAQWLRNLIAAGHISDGTVDERSIADIRPDELVRYSRVHFFAGIAGWDYALRLAGWPEDRPVWTGSCPCQPFSSAARGRNRRELDVSSEFVRLVSSVRPRIVFGEQVTSTIWFEWFCDEMEALDYSIGAAILPALSIRQDHIRNRIYFACYADSASKPVREIYEKASRVSRDRCESDGMAHSHGISPRMGRLRAYGNAIVPQVAAEFIRAFMETE